MLCRSSSTRTRIPAMLVVQDLLNLGRRRPTWLVKDWRGFGKSAWRCPNEPSKDRPDVWAQMSRSGEVSALPPAFSIILEPGQCTVRQISPRPVRCVAIMGIAGVISVLRKRLIRVTIQRHVQRRILDKRSRDASLKSASWATSSCCV
jgi:hypothetical protein